MFYNPNWQQALMQFCRWLTLKTRLGLLASISLITLIVLKLLLIFVMY